jgi:putative oxidoreductase
MVSLGLLLLRLVVGGIFVLHGLPKLFGGQGSSERLSDTATATLGEGFVGAMEHGGIQNLTGMLGQMEIPNPPTMAWALALTEFGGGLGLILGWKTRPLAAGLAFSQLVAINKVHASQGLVGGYEFNATLIGATSALALAGPGKIALD